MKYRVTEKHPAYKEGLEIIDNILILTGTDDWGGIFPETITDWVNLGWIEEIQEAEFTKDELLRFAVSYYNARYSDKYTFYADDHFKKWIKKYKDEK